VKHALLLEMLQQYGCKLYNFICSGIECGNPFSSIDRTGGYIDDIALPPFYVGHQLIFACSSSYRLRGSANRTCLNNGQWSGVTAACDLNGKL